VYSLLQGCRKGDRASQKQLYELLNGFALKTCYAFRAEPVQELAHEAFIKLFKHIDQFDESRHHDLLISLKGWFKRIIINTCIDHLRKNASYRNVKFFQTAPDWIPDNGSNGFDNLSYNDILNAIRELSPVYRSVFNMFVIEGLSHEEIAQQLGISVGTSKSNLSKARENLKKILAKRTTPIKTYREDGPHQLRFG